MRDESLGEYVTDIDKPAGDFFESPQDNVVLIGSNFSRHSYTFRTFLILLHDSALFGELEVELLHGFEVVRLHEYGVGVHFRQGAKWVHE